MAKNLSQDGRDQILELMDMPGWQLILEQLEACVEVRERDVLSLDLSNSNSNELVIRKARAEGARQAVADFQRRLKTLRSPSKSGKPE